MRDLWNVEDILNWEFQGTYLEFCWLWIKKTKVTVEEAAPWCNYFAALIVTLRLTPVKQVNYPRSFFVRFPINDRNGYYHHGAERCYRFPIVVLRCLLCMEKWKKGKGRFWYSILTWCMLNETDAKTFLCSDWRSSKIL